MDAEKLPVARLIDPCYSEQALERVEALLRQVRAGEVSGFAILIQRPGGDTVTETYFRGRLEIIGAIQLMLAAAIEV